MELDADDNHHKFIYLDEAGFTVIWPRQGGEVGISLVRGQPSKYLDNVGPTLLDVKISEDGVVAAYLILDHIMQLSLSPFLMSSIKFVELKV